MNPWTLKQRLLQARLRPAAIVQFARQRWQWLLRSKTGGDAAIYLGSKFLTKLLTLGLLPVWTHLLSPAEYGTIGTLLAWAGFVGPLIVLGLPSAVVRFYQNYKADVALWHGFLASLAVFLALMVAGVAALTSAVGPNIWEIVSSGRIPYYPLVPITVGTVCFTAFARLALAAHQAARMAWKAVGIEQVWSTGLILTSLFFVAALDMGATGYMLGGVVHGCLLTAVLTTVFLRRTSGWRLSGGMVKEALIYSAPLVPQAVAAWILSLSDRVMLERFRSLEETGYYNLAVNLGLVMSFIAVSMNQATTPRYFELMQEGGAHREERSRLLAVGTLAVIGACAIGMMAFAPPLLAALAADRFAPSAAYVVPIVAGYHLLGVYQTFMRPLLYTRRTGVIGALTAMAAILNVVLNLIFIPRWGAMAAALTTVFCYFLTAAMCHAASRRVDRMGLKRRATLALTLVPLLAGAVLQFCPYDTWPWLILRAGVGLAAAGLVTLGAWLALGRSLSWRPPRA